MIVKVERQRGVNAVGDALWKVSPVVAGSGMTYTGGMNADMLEAMGARKVAYFEAEMGPDGLEIGKEVPEGKNA